MTNDNNQFESDCLHKKDICCLCDELEDIFRWVEKWVVLKSSYFSEHKKEESMMCLCFLNI